MGSIPPRTRDQRLEALALAHDVRSRRGGLWRAFKAEGRPAASWAAGLVLDPPSWLESFHVEAFLHKLPQLGPRSATRWLLDLDISEHKTIGGLSEEQRVALARRLDLWANRERWLRWEKRRRERERYHRRRAAT